MIPTHSPTLIIMKIISWNIMGLNGRSKQRLLRNCITIENPYILLLQEMKFVGDEAQLALARCWRQILSVFIDSRGEVGGLAILWNPNLVTLDNFFSTPWSISARYRVLALIRWVQ
jgi:exonuclease III